MTAMDIRRTANGAAWRRWPGAVDRQPTIMMLHGLASNGSRWRELAEALVPACGCTLLAPDLRGHGVSERYGRIDSAVWCRDLCAILDAEGLERVVLGGHCLGANVALRFAETHPDRVRALILVEPMLAAARTGKVRRFARLRRLLPPLAALARGINALGIRRRRFEILDLYEIDRQTRRLMREQGSDDAMTRRYAAPLSDLRYLPLAAYLQALNETLRPVPPLDEIEHPALALLSAGGLFGDPVITERLLRQMPKVRIARLAAKHWIPTEQPEALQQHVRAFLESLTGENAGPLRQG